MNTDQVKGTAKEVAGKTQKNVGKAIGSTEQEAKGMAREAEGKVQKNVGNAEETLKDSTDSALNRKP
ncbi:MAG TPA: CsbD family protein [Burkholderiaceae bacterium]|nr:CsbD family protein [Burkholderiaceae bacterium]